MFDIVRPRTGHGEELLQLTPGLIGDWSPGIGDPTVGGWLTVILYFTATWTTWRLLRAWGALDTPVPRHERLFWNALLIALIALGLNKQLDLQSAATEIGRILSEQQGWYKHRRQVQEAFIAGIAIMGLTVLAATLSLTWRAPGATLFALVGSVCLVVFVVVRAASFHHVDAWLGTEFSGLRLNWLLEMGGLLVIIAAAWRRQKGTRCLRSKL